MPIFSKDSLETLRQRIDLVDLLGSHIDLKKAGASYKALCPFHDEKSPSFMVQKGDSHYHCFGCGAHGDAITFLMTHLKMNFSDAVEHLAQRYHVVLEHVEGSGDKKGPNKAVLKEALEQASRFYQFMLLHTEEGHAALTYLIRRGLDIEFVKQFQIGLAPKAPGLLRKAMHAKFIKDETLHEVGLIAPGKESGWRDFFYDRITFPICDATGAVIGFSARKYKEDTFGGKYVNTPETPLFKKSRVLFGLHFSRRRIAKERKAIIVEGQIDALRLIQAGFNITVAGQGTAFGEGHVRELIHLGINQVFLALDSDDAGQEGISKIGNLFQKEGVEVRVVKLLPGYDPDLFLREYGTAAFLKLLEDSTDYLAFLVKHESRRLNVDSPAGKNELVLSIAERIRSWNQPLMVHESLRRLAHLLQVPENMIGVDQGHSPNVYIKKSASAGLHTIDPDRILETDFLRWLFVMGDQHAHYIEWAKLNIAPEAIKVPLCRCLYQTYIEAAEQQRPRDLLSLAAQVEDAEVQVLLGEIVQKKINKDRAEPLYIETLQKILDRNWMQWREELKMKIQSGQCSDDEAMTLAKEFERIKRSPPKVKITEVVHAPDVL